MDAVSCGRGLCMYFAHFSVPKGAELLPGARSDLGNRALALLRTRWSTSRSAQSCDAADPSLDPAWFQWIALFV